MRFNEFFEERVDEKVDKKEMDKALANPNIFVGAEFEFISDQLAEYGGRGSEHQDAYSNAMYDYNSFNDEWREYEETRNEIYDRMTGAEERKNELENDDIPEKEQEIEDLEEQWESYNDEIKELLEQQSDTEDDEERVRLDAERQDLEQSQSTIGGSLQTAKDELKNLNQEFEDTEQELLEAEKESDYLDYPAPGVDYTDYMEEMQNEFGIGGGFNEYYFEEGELNEPPDPPESGLDDEYAWKEALRDIEDQVFGDFPLNVDIEVTEYHEQQQSIGDTYWKAEFDSSIADEGGIELISPPMRLPEFLEACPRIFAWIERKGGTNSSCGFHVHMSVEGIDDLRAVLDPVKLMLMTDEGAIWNFFEGRELNTYAKSSKISLSERGVSEDDINKLIHKEKLERKLASGHFEAINFQNWEKGHIEFRQMGGRNYTKKWNQVKTILGQFSFNLSVSVDKNWKSQEYMTKLTRVGNKLDNYKYRHLISYMESMAGQLQHELKTNKYLDADDKKTVTTTLKYLDIQKKKIKMKMPTVGAKPDENMELALRNNRDFMKNLDTYAKTTLTDIVNMTKLPNIDVVLDEIEPYIERSKLKRK